MSTLRWPGRPQSASTGAWPSDGASLRCFDGWRAWWKRQWMPASAAASREGWRWSRWPAALGVPQERPQLDRPLPAGWPEGGAAAYRAPARQGQGWVPFRHARACTGGPTGHTPRLSDAQLAAVRQALRQGARAHGFDTDHWTLERIATVIEQVTGSPTIPGTCGSCCAVGWAGGCSVPPAGPSRVTSKPSSGGWRATGRGSGKHARRRSAVIVFWDESGSRCWW